MVRSRVSKIDSGGSGIMKHLFEQFLTAGEDWLQSAIVVNTRSRKKGARRGQYVWKKFHKLVEEQLHEIQSFKFHDQAL